jgi:hypothetical protein
MLFVEAALRLGEAHERGDYAGSTALYEECRHGLKIVE